MNKQEQWDNTHQRIMAAWNSGLNAKQIRETLDLGENTVLRHLRAAGLSAQRRIREQEAAVRAAREAELLAARVFRDMQGRQLALFDATRICEVCGAFLPPGRPKFCSEECAAAAHADDHVYTYDHAAVECQRCHCKFEANRMGRAPKYCPSCAPLATKEKRKQYKKTHKLPCNIAGNFNQRGRRACRRYGGHYEPVNPKTIFERDGWICYLCGIELKRGPWDASPNSPTIDHVIPLSAGGDHTPDNMHPCCFECNSKKSGTLPEEVTCCA